MNNFPVVYVDIVAVDTAADTVVVVVADVDIVVVVGIEEPLPQLFQYHHSLFAL